MLYMNQISQLIALSSLYLPPDYHSCLPYFALYCSVQCKDFGLRDLLTDHESIYLRSNGLPISSTSMTPTQSLTTSKERTWYQ